MLKYTSNDTSDYSYNASEVSDRFYPYKMAWCRKYSIALYSSRFSKEESCI